MCLTPGHQTSCQHQDTENPAQNKWSQGREEELCECGAPKAGSGDLNKSTHFEPRNKEPLIQKKRRGLAE